MPLSPRRLPGFLAFSLAVFLLGPGFPVARGAENAAEDPVQNTSYVRDDAPALRRTFADADAAIQKEDWTTAVRLLQQVVDATDEPDVPLAAAPDVEPVWGTLVYEGAWLVAEHRLAGGDARLRAAYEQAYGTVADSLVARGIATRDPSVLARAADRFLPLEAGRRAAFLLSDLALRDGDADRALGWLERLQDLEEVSSEAPGKMLPWVEARVRRMAAALARPDQMEAATKALLAAADPAVPESRRWAPLPPSMRRAPSRGAPEGSAAPPPSLPPDAKLELAWERPLGGARVLANAEEDRETDPLPRPSPFFPARAVVQGGFAFVNDGGRLEAWQLATGRLAAVETDRGEDADTGLSVTTVDEVREDRGLIEGDSIALGPSGPEGQWLYAAIPPLWAGGDWSYESPRNDHLTAFVWDGRRLQRRWTAGGDADEAGLDQGTRLYGTPLLYRGRLWIAGIVPSAASAVQADAWLFALDPVTGKLLRRTWLGAGVPIRTGRADEAVPSSPAGAAGRVVVSTSLGIVASVSAEDGRIAWLYRNDRGVAGTGRPLRLGTEADSTPRPSGFVNQPPRIAWERVWVAPTDGPWITCLFDRPRGKDRVLVSRRLHRRHDFDAFAVEQVVGVTVRPGDQRPLLVLVGKSAAGETGPPAPVAIGLDALEPDVVLWRAHVTTGDGAEPFGQAALTTTSLLVPTRHGICLFALEDGAARGTVDRADVPAKLAGLLPADLPLFGNVQVVSGQGILVLGGQAGTWWKVRHP